MVLDEFTNENHKPYSFLDPKLAEALSFVRDARMAFQFDPSPNNYEKLLIVLKAFKNTDLNTLECLKLSAILLKRFPHLISAFNSFAPRGWSIQLQNGKTFVHHDNIAHEADEEFLESSSAIFSGLNTDNNNENNDENSYA